MNALTLDLDRGFHSAELQGIKLAAKGRLIAVATFAIYSPLAYSGPLLYNTLAYLAAFGLLALAMLYSSRTGLVTPWVKYLLVALEVFILAQAVLTPNPFNPAPWPDAMVFRYDNFYFFFVLIAVSVFSYTPGLVLWAGVCTALAWGVGVALLVSRADIRILSEVIGQADTSQDILDLYVNPHVVVISGRAKEMVTALLVSVLLAAVVWRSRRTVRDLIRAEQDRHMLSDLFGRYVPAQIASAIIEDRGILEPEERQATLLFADLEGFTSIVEGMAPADALSMLNEYFSAATELIGRYNGVVTQFQGDAILATFNVPVEDPEHAVNAVHAASNLLHMMSSRQFAGQTLSLRIGINTGPVVAGSVGGANRMLYTVHGDAVNTAARLEELNKAHGTRLLVAETTQRLAKSMSGWRKVSEEILRGHSRAVSIYSIN